MRALVTGVAGFIGSHLAEALVAQGHVVRGVDAFLPTYDEAAKRRNLSTLLRSQLFELRELDLRRDARGLLDGVDVVFHQAGQPGVRDSWAAGFASYVEHNVLVTQRLLEAARKRPVERFVYASSSSVYGNACRYPCKETDLPGPHSPYGVTKLAGEQLCRLYAANWNIPTTSLRYFTVFGPRQRPDMGIHRFIEAALDGRRLRVYGDGEQVRDFTYVDDVVAANLMAAATDVAPGTVMNIAGGCSTTVNALLAQLADLADLDIAVTHLAEQPGDVRITGGSTARAERLLGWAPATDLATGLAQQITWHMALRSDRVVALPKPIALEALAVRIAMSQQ